MKSTYKYFTIFAGMRTGSNLLERMLGQLDGVNIHGELFNPSFIGKPGQEELFGFSRAAREARPFALIDQMVLQSYNSLPGFRLFSDHDNRVLRRALSDPLCAKIILTRDILESYVSLKIAQETDQWMLRNNKKRRDAQIRFDANEFQDYKQKTIAYYATVRRLLQTNGQSAFFIDYKEIKDIATLNGLISFIGLETRFEKIEEPILRQNPSPLTEKVMNPEEMLSACSGQMEQQDLSAHPGHGSKISLRLLSSAQKVPLLYARIPGGPEEKIYRWMHSADGGDPMRENFAQAFEDGETTQNIENRKFLRTWIQNNPDRLIFTVLRHPVERAYQVFEQKILPGGENGFPMIREQLRQNFRMRVPDEEHVMSADREALERIGYDETQHRAAFHAFLEFVRANLLGQTSLRQDAHWASQKDYVAGFQGLMPLNLVVREDQLIKTAAFIRNTLNLGQLKNAVLRQPNAQYLFPIEKIITQETHALARAAWPDDFSDYGFVDWRPSA